MRKTNWVLVMTVALGLVSPAGAGAAAAERFDLVVYGGTASGVMTAISAAREGAKVALLEPTQHVGGMVTGGLGKTDYANKGCIGGMALDFYKRLGKHYGKDIVWYPEPHVAEETLLAMLEEAGVKPMFGERLVEDGGVTTSPAHIDSIRMESGRQFEADVFADCSYEGDLMAKAGVSYTWGRESQAQYGEELAGVRERTPLHQFKVEVAARDTSGTLLPMIQDGPKGDTGAADKKVQAYNFRLCMTQNKANQVPFPKPEGYNPHDWDLLARMVSEEVSATLESPVPNNLMILSLLEGGEKTDTNNRGAISTDFIGGRWDYPDASYARRQQIWDEHYNYVAGFLYFLANDTRVPQALHDEMNTWGLAADEFMDTNHWPRQLYVREARRMIGDYVMTQRDIQTSRTKVVSIGMGSYNSDSHNVQRFENAQGFAENEGDMQVKVKPYEIPFRIITPRAEEMTNLLVPVCLSASHVAYSTVRMEPQYMIMGEAAGIAAAMAAEKDVAVQKIDTRALTAKLKERKAVLELKSAKK